MITASFSLPHQLSVTAIDAVTAFLHYAIAPPQQNLSKSSPYQTQKSTTQKPKQAYHTSSQSTSIPSPLFPPSINLDLSHSSCYFHIKQLGNVINWLVNQFGEGFQANVAVLGRISRRGFKRTKQLEIRGLRRTRLLTKEMVVGRRRKGKKRVAKDNGGCEEI